MDNVTLLSTSTIGSPSASSTAIKPISFRRLTGSKISENTKGDLSSASNNGVLQSPMELNSSISETTQYSPMNTMVTTSSGAAEFMLHFTESHIVDSTNRHDHTSSASLNGTTNDYPKPNINGSPKTDSHSTVTNEPNSRVTNSKESSMSESEDQHRHDDEGEDITKVAKQWVDTSDPFQSNTSLSMIENETEPTIIREAAEFSLFNRENLQTPSNDDDSIMGEDNVNEMGVANPLGSSMTSYTSRIGVAETTSTIASTTVGEPMGLSAYLIPSTPPADSLMTEADGVYQALGDTTGQLHDNPFDSSDEFSQGFEEFDIGVRDTETLLNELKQDEKLLHQESMQSSLTSPLCFDTTFSAVSSNNTSHTNKPPSTEIDMSMTTYFESKSYPLGSSFSVDNSSTERPAFGPHDLVSPPGVCSSTTTTPTHSKPSPDTTVTSLSPSLAITTSKASSSSVTLSPLITPLSPDTAALPQLDLANILSNISSTSDIRTSTSRTSNTVCSSHPPLLSTVSPVISPTNVKGTVSVAPLTPSPHPNDLPSLYFQASSTINNSTLMVSELSVLPITPAPSKLHLLNTTNNNLTTVAYTPSIADTTKFCDFSEIGEVSMQQKESNHLPMLSDQIRNDSTGKSNMAAESLPNSEGSSPSTSTDDEDMSMPKKVPHSNNESVQVLDDNIPSISAGTTPQHNGNGRSTSSVSPSLTPYKELPSIKSDIADTKGASLTSVLDESTLLSGPSSPSSIYKSQPSDLFKPSTSIPPAPSESIASSSSSSPSFNAILTKSASKTAQIKALLDSTTMNAQSFLASLKAGDLHSSPRLLTQSADVHNPPPSSSSPSLLVALSSGHSQVNDLQTSTGTHHYSDSSEDMPHPHSDSPRPLSSSSRSTSPSLSSSNGSIDNERLQQTPSIDSRPQIHDHDTTPPPPPSITNDSALSDSNSHHSPNPITSPPSPPSLLLPAAQTTSLIVSQLSDTIPNEYHHTIAGDVSSTDTVPSPALPHDVPASFQSIPTHSYTSSIDSSTFSLPPATVHTMINNTSSLVSATVSSSNSANQISSTPFTLNNHVSLTPPISSLSKPQETTSFVNHTPFPNPSMSNDCTFCTPLISSSVINTKTPFYSLPVSDSPLSTPFSLATHPNLKQEIDLPEVITFEDVSCVCTRQQTQLAIKNKSEKWLQYRLEISEVQINDVKVNGETKIFDCPSKCFIGPWKEEIIKISFIPLEAGSHTATLRLIPHSKSITTNATPSSLSTVQLQASAEVPQIQITTDDGNTNIMDYGVVLAGNRSSKSVYLVNHGQASVPLVLALSLDTPSWSCFSLESSTIGAEDHSDHQATTIRIVLPGKHANQDNPPVYAFLVHFNPPIKPSSSHELQPVSSYPEKYSSKMDVFIDSAIDTPDTIIADLYLEAVVGIVRLHAPRSLQTVSFTCPVGSTVTQSCPLKNAGNIPITVQAECDQPDWFIVKPVAMVIQPNEESFVQILFNPLKPIKTIESNLFLVANPNGPIYQIKLRGVTTEPRLPEFVDKGMLECNHPSMFWTGVDIGKQSSYQDLVIRSTYSITTVTLNVQIRDPEIFKFQASSNKLCSGLKISLDPNSVYKFQVMYVPSSITLQHSFIDILDSVHDRKYKVPLFGYGGQSSITLSNCVHTDKGMIADIGEVCPGKQCIKSLKLTNIGERPGFVRALGFPVDNNRGDSVNIIPEKVMIHPKQTKVLQVVYTVQKNIMLSQLRQDHHQSHHPLAKLVLYTGDEIVRRLVMSLTQYREGDSELVNSLGGYFIEQDTVPSDFEHVPIEGIVTTNLLESHTTTHNVTLTGRIGSPPDPIPFPSMSPPCVRPQAQPTLTNVPMPKPSIDKILQVQSVTFIDTVVKEFEENSLLISNPYPVVMKWRLLSPSPAFVKEVDSSSGSLFKSKYSPFWVHQCSGEIKPHSQTTVSVSFQPQDVGLHSQLWYLQVTTSGSETRKLKLSFGGRAVGHHHNVTRQKLFPEVRSESNQSNKVHQPIVSKSDSSNKHNPQTAKRSKHLVYLQKDRVDFPTTEVGKVVVEKLVVYNKDTCEHKFQVIKPHPPFSVVHYEFTLRQRECARLPIYFTPIEPSKSFESIVGIRTYSGDQMFSILRGRSV